MGISAWKPLIIAQWSPLCATATLWSNTFPTLAPNSWNSLHLIIECLTVRKSVVITTCDLRNVFHYPTVHCGFSINARVNGWRGGWMGGWVDVSHFTSLWSPRSLDLLSSPGCPREVLWDHHPKALSQVPAGHGTWSALKGAVNWSVRRGNRLNPSDPWSLVKEEQGQSNMTWPLISSKPYTCIHRPLCLFPSCGHRLLYL